MDTYPKNDEWQAVSGELGQWFEIRRTGEIRNRETHQLVKTRIVQGYRMLSTRREGRSIARKIATMLWETYIGPIPDGYCVDHKNRNSLDDRLNNYRLITLAQNRLNSCASRRSRTGFTGVVVRELATCTRYQARARHGDDIRVGPNRRTAEKAARDRDQLLYEMLPPEDFGIAALNFPDDYGRSGERSAADRSNTWRENLNR